MTACKVPPFTIPGITLDLPPALPELPFKLPKWPDLGFPLNFKLPTIPGITLDLPPALPELPFKLPLPFPCPLD